MKPVSDEASQGPHRVPYSQIFTPASPFRNAASEQVGEIR